MMNMAMVINAALGVCVGGEKLQAPCKFRSGLVAKTWVDVCRYRGA